MDAYLTNSVYSTLYSVCHNTHHFGRGVRNKPKHKMPQAFEKVIYVPLQGKLFGFIWWSG